MASYQNQKNSLEDFAPFFGDDQKGGQFVQALYEGTDYTNKATPPTALMKQLLRAENYVGFRNNRAAKGGETMGPDDVHFDVTDLIVNAALFHKKIDQATKAGTSLGSLIDELTNVVLKLLNLPLPEEFKKAISDSTYSEGFKRNFINSNYGTIKIIDNIKDVVNKNIRENQDTNNLNAKSKVPIENLIENNVEKIVENYSAIHGDINLDKDDVLENIEKEVNKEIENDLKMVNVGRTNNQDIVERIAFENVPKYTSLYHQLLKPMYTKYFEFHTAQHSKNMYTTLKNPDAKKFFEKVYMNWENLETDARNFYMQNIALFQKNTSSNPSYDYKTPRNQTMASGWMRLTNEEIEKMAKGKTVNDHNLDDYRVNLMKKPETGEVLFQANLPDVPENVNIWYTSTYGPNIVKGADSSFFRDLYKKIYEENKEEASEADRKREETPPLPSRSETAPFRSPPDDIPYAFPPGYSSTREGLVGGANEIPKDIEKELKNRNTRPFDFNMGKLIQNIALNKVQGDAATPEKKNIGTIFTEYPHINAVDMAYGRVWTWDSQKQQHFRIENGKKKYYDDEARSDPTTCYATYLSKDIKTCKTLLSCLIDGNPQTLTECGGILDMGKADMWKVAKEDIDKASPDMIKIIFRKFNIQAEEKSDGQGGIIKIPTTYERWEHEFLSKIGERAKIAINKNIPLKEYIRALITIVRANPSILNHTNPNVVARYDVPQRARDLGLTEYLPLQSGKKQTQLTNFASWMRNATTPRVVNNDLWNPLVSGSMSNASFFSPFMTPSPNMMGGNFYAQRSQTGGQFPDPQLLPSRNASDQSISNKINLLNNGSSTIFVTLISSLSSALNDVGIRIHEDDKKRMKDAVEQISKYEYQLGELCVVLRDIVKLARFYGVSLHNTDRENPRVVKLTEMRTPEDMSTFVRCYVRDITKNMATNMSIQQATASELMGKIIPRFCDESAKIDTGLDCDKYKNTNDSLVSF